MFSSLHNFEMNEIEAFVDISLSPIIFADVCREHWYLPSRVTLGHCTRTVLPKTLPCVIPGTTFN